MMKIRQKKVIEQESLKNSSNLSNALSFIAISFWQSSLVKIFHKSKKKSQVTTSVGLV